MTRTLAMEPGKKGIMVNYIAPGLIETSLWETLPDDVKQRLLEAQPTGKISSPKDISPVVTFFASDDTSYVTGQTFYFCRCKSLFANIA